MPEAINDVAVFVCVAGNQGELTQGRVTDLQLPMLADETLTEKKGTSTPTPFTNILSPGYEFSRTKIAREYVLLVSFGFGLDFEMQQCECDCFVSWRCI